MIDLSNWVVVAATIATVCLCVVIHYEALSLIIRLLKRFYRVRPRMIVVILGVMFTHVIEVWLFGFAYYGLIVGLDLGELQGLATGHITDYVYYSTVVYTTLGFGDVIPNGPIRFLTGMEAISGLVLITWSASFAFIEMQRNWKF